LAVPFSKAPLLAQEPLQESCFTTDLLCPLPANTAQSLVLRLKGKTRAFAKPRHAPGFGRRPRRIWVATQGEAAQGFGMPPLRSVTGTRRLIGVGSQGSPLRSLNLSGFKVSLCYTFKPSLAQRSPSASRLLSATPSSPLPCPSSHRALSLHLPQTPFR